MEQIELKLNILQKQNAMLYQIINNLTAAVTILQAALRAIFEEFYIDEKQEIEQVYKQLMQATPEQKKQILENTQYMKFGLQLYEALQVLDVILNATAPKETKQESKIIEFPKTFES